MSGSLPGGWGGSQKGGCGAGGGGSARRGGRAAEARARPRGEGRCSSPWQRRASPKRACVWLERKTPSPVAPRAGKKRTAPKVSVHTAAARAGLHPAPGPSAPRAGRMDSPAGDAGPCAGARAAGPAASLRGARAPLRAAEALQARVGVRPAPRAGFCLRRRRPRADGRGGRQAPGKAEAEGRPGNSGPRPPPLPCGARRPAEGATGSAARAPAPGSAPRRPRDPPSAFLSFARRPGFGLLCDLRRDELGPHLRGGRPRWARWLERSRSGRAHAQVGVRAPGPTFLSHVSVTPSLLNQ